MKETYTSAEARETLQVDAKTFLRWLEQGNIQPQVSKADHRVKLFTHEQIEQLAEEHERTIDESDLEPFLPRAMTDSLVARIEALERKVSELEGMVRRPEKYREVQIKKDYHTSAPAQGDTLPGDLVSYPQFARIHSISVSTVQKAVDAGRLAVVRGQWKQGKSIVQNALDASGRAQFYTLYHGNEHFVECAECPHHE